MAIKRVTYDTLKFLVAEIKERYAEKGDIGALGGLDKVDVENLTEDLKSLINGKADAATTLDRNRGSRRYFHSDCRDRPLKPCNGRQHGRY